MRREPEFVLQSYPRRGKYGNHLEQFLLLNHLADVIRRHPACVEQSHKCPHTCSTYAGGPDTVFFKCFYCSEMGKAQCAASAEAKSDVMFRNFFHKDFLHHKNSNYLIRIEKRLFAIPKRIMLITEVMINNAMLPIIIVVVVIIFIIFICLLFECITILVHCKGKQEKLISKFFLNIFQHRILDKKKPPNSIMTDSAACINKYLIFSTLCGEYGTRTHHLQIANLTLYQMS